jgi:hypothetical protein
MRTFFLMVALVILGCIARIIVPFVIAILSLPGKLIIFPNALGRCSNPRLIVGILVTTLLQSCLYLPYTVFVAVWTLLSIEKEKVGLVALFAALFAVIFPVGTALRDAKMHTEKVRSLFRGKRDESAQNKANERERKSHMAFQAVSITFLSALVCFLVLVFFPKIAQKIYDKIPFVAHLVTPAE